MAFIASMLLPVAVCLLLAGITATLWWSSFSNPWLYLTLSVLTLLGLHRVLQFLAEVVKLFPGTGGYFLEARRDPVRFVELAQESLTIEAFIVSGLVVATGVPVLMALRTALVRA
jgi:hypothetical protein